MNWAQLWALLWLRVRLTRNTWRRSRGMGPLLGILSTVFLVFLALGSFALALFLGLFALSEASEVWICGGWIILCFIFFLWWTVGTVTELQRTELLDMGKLLHLPVELGQLFFVNYLASVVGISTAVVVPAMTGLSLGLAWTRGPQMLLTLPVALALVFAVSAWTYLVQGWLATQVQNPRRRRVITTLLTLFVILAAQAPNLYLNVLPALSGGNGRAARNARMEHQGQRLLGLIEMADFIPPIWPGAAARHLARGELGFSFIALGGLVAMGALGLLRGYRGTLRYYLGSGTSSAGKAAPAAKRPVKPRTGTVLVERSLPFVSEQVSALVTATLRSLARAPEVLMGFGVSMMASCIFVVFGLSRFGPRAPESLRPLLLVGGLGMVLLSIIQFASNAFGFDRDGLRALLLSPMPRSRILLAKNLSMNVLGLVPGTLVLVGGVWFMRVPPLALLAAFAQLLLVLLLVTVAGNLASVLAPYKVAAGSMKASRPGGLAMLIVLAQTFFLVPFLLAFAAAGPGVEWLLSEHGEGVASLANLVVSLGMLAGGVGLYAVTLEPMGALLQRRETGILAKVTAEEA